MFENSRNSRKTGKPKRRIAFLRGARGEAARRPRRTETARGESCELAGRQARASEASSFRSKLTTLCITDSPKTAHRQRAVPKSRAQKPDPGSNTESSRKTRSKTGTYTGKTAPHIPMQTIAPCLPAGPLHAWRGCRCVRVCLHRKQDGARASVAVSSFAALADNSRERARCSRPAICRLCRQLGLFE